MPTIKDPEFGNVIIKRSSNSSQIRLRVAPNGNLRVSVPIYTPVFLVKRMLNASRSEIRELLKKSSPSIQFENGMTIGKSHTLIIQKTLSKQVDVFKHGRQIIVRLPVDLDINNEKVSRKIRDLIISALRLEAKSYLPKRLSYLAEKFGFSYSKSRFSHAGSRWGSCSSNGTISLNIGLMKLPYEIIDYVIIHELSHTIHMNHGKDFWLLVSKFDPNYKSHRKILKTKSPAV